MRLFEVYLRAYCLSRSRSPIPADELPKSTATMPKLPELVAFALGVGDGPVKDAPDQAAQVCRRVVERMNIDAAELLAIAEADARVRAAQATANPTLQSTR